MKECFRKAFVEFVSTVDGLTWRWFETITDPPMQFTTGWLCVPPSRAYSPRQQPHPQQRDWAKNILSDRKWNILFSVLSSSECRPSSKGWSVALVGGELLGPGLCCGSYLLSYVKMETSFMCYCKPAALSHHRPRHHTVGRSWPSSALFWTCTVEAERCMSLFCVSVFVHVCSTNLACVCVFFINIFNKRGTVQVDKPQF